MDFILEQAPIAAGVFVGLSYLLYPLLVRLIRHPREIEIRRGNLKEPYDWKVLPNFFEGEEEREDRRAKKREHHQPRVRVKRGQKVRWIIRDVPANISFRFTFHRRLFGPSFLIYLLGGLLPFLRGRGSEVVVSRNDVGDLTYERWVHWSAPAGESPYSVEILDDGEDTTIFAHGSDTELHVDPW